MEDLFSQDIFSQYEDNLVLESTLNNVDEFLKDESKKNEVLPMTEGKCYFFYFLVMKQQS